MPCIIKISPRQRAQHKSWYASSYERSVIGATTTWRTRKFSFNIFCNFFWNGTQPPSNIIVSMYKAGAVDALHTPCTVIQIKYSLSFFYNIWIIQNKRTGTIQSLLLRSPETYYNGTLWIR